MITWIISIKLTQQPALLVNFCRLASDNSWHHWPTTRPTSWSIGLTPMLTLSTDIRYLPTTTLWSTAIRLIPVKIAHWTVFDIIVTYSRSPCSRRLARCAYNHPAVTAHRRRRNRAHAARPRRGRPSGHSIIHGIRPGVTLASSVSDWDRVD